MARFAVNIRTTPFGKERRLLFDTRARKLNSDQLLRSCFSAYLGKVVEGVHELGGWIYAVDVHAVGDVEEDVGVVEDNPDAGFDHQLGDTLSGGRGGGDNADDLVGLRDALLPLVSVLDDDVADGASNLLRVIVEDVVD